MKNVFVLSLLTLATSTLAAPAPSASTSAAPTPDNGWKFWITRKECGGQVSWACGKYKAGDCSDMQDIQVQGGDPGSDMAFNVTNCLGRNLWVSHVEGTEWEYSIEGSNSAFCDKPALNSALAYEDPSLQGCGESKPDHAGDCTYVPWYFCRER